MALELARYYHPRSKDPIASLTIPEILTVIDFASHDLAELVDQYLPGGHLLTVNHWRNARKATEWYQTATNVYWVVAALFSPVNTGLRFAASRVGLSMPLEMLQQNLLLWFFTAYLHRLGKYLIDLNSGRLRVAARRYPQLVEGKLADGDLPPPAEVEKVKKVTITLMGQVKAGKSSVINALSGEQRADRCLAVDRGSQSVRAAPRRHPDPAGVVGHVRIWPRRAEGRSGCARPRKRRRVGPRAARSPRPQSSPPGRCRDAKGPAGLVRRPAGRQDAADSGCSHPYRSPVSGDGVVPPYNWQQPQRPKESQIQQAMTTVRDQLGDYLVGVVPVCAGREKSTVSRNGSCRRCSSCWTKCTRSPCSVV